MELLAAAADGQAGVGEGAGGEEAAVDAGQGDRGLRGRFADQEAALELAGAAQGDRGGVGEVPQQVVAVAVQRVVGVVDAAAVGVQDAGGAGDVDQDGGPGRDVGEDDALLTAGRPGEVEVGVEDLERRGAVTGEQGLAALVHGGAGRGARHTADPGVAVGGGRELGAQGGVGLDGVGVGDGGSGHRAADGTGVPDDPALGHQVLAARDGDPGAGGEEVGAVRGRDPGADAGDADVVDRADTGLLRLVEGVQDDDAALGLGGAAPDQEVTADEDVDAVVPTGERAVVDRGGVSGGAAAGHTGPESAGQRGGRGADRARAEREDGDEGRDEGAGHRQGTGPSADAGEQSVEGSHARSVRQFVRTRSPLGRPPTLMR